ncbi:MAG: aldo/keto reductase [Actinomycetota bacterium]|nr:aldo/keto reductase [Actinomycetota bacterium]
MAIATLPFGRTGHHSTRIVFGGAALAHATQAEADRALEVLLRHGVNHIDVASSYGDAEARVRPWLERCPGQFFVATKCDQRSAVGAREELHRSLERLGVDKVDLWQLHSLADPIEWDTALSPGGALEAAVQAREEGLVDWIGVTGHGLQIAAMHRRSMERFDFDSVLLPYNYPTMQNGYYKENFEALASDCSARGTAVQTIKSLAARPWAGREHTRATWYEPLEEPSDIDLAVWWALARPDVFVASAGDLALLPHVLDAASRFGQQLPDEGRLADLVATRRLEPIFV